MLSKNLVVGIACIFGIAHIPTSAWAESHDLERAMLVDDVDLVELNHYYDDQGKHILDQLIYYDWCNVRCRFQVRDWRLQRSEFQIPMRRPDGMYSSTFKDGDVVRKVRSASFRETWTQYDPELQEREFLDKAQRRLLDKRHCAKQQ